MSRIKIRKCVAIGCGKAHAIREGYGGSCPYCGGKRFLPVMDKKEAEELGVFVQDPSKVAWGMV